MNAPRQFQRRYFVKRESTVGAIKIEKYINTTCEDSSQKRTGFYNRNRKRSPLFTYTVAKHYNQRNKKIIQE